MKSSFNDQNMAFFSFFRFQVYIINTNNSTIPIAYGWDKVDKNVRPIKKLTSWEKASSPKKIAKRYVKASAKISRASMHVTSF